MKIKNKPQRKIKKNFNKTKTKLRNQKQKSSNKRVKLSEKSMPSTLQMAKNLSNSIVKNVTGVIKGERLKVEPEVAKQRMDICIGCEFITGELNNERCRSCGCWLRLKTQFQAEHCPIEKW